MRLLIRLSGIALLLLPCIPAYGNIKWHNPHACGYHVVQNQGWNSELSGSYARLPERARNSVRKDVWDLSRNSAGLAVHFYSNAPEIQVRYKVKGALQMPHMPATGASGMDLYSIDKDGKWDFCFGNYSFADTIRFTFHNLKGRHSGKGAEYRLFLPLYNSVECLEIGIGEQYWLEFIPASLEKPIVLYGTSIAHGACASRPAMSWANILNRKLDYPLINMGFSGNGRLEKEVIGLIAEIPSRLYILDCLPNLTGLGEEEVCRLTVEAVNQLREHTQAPVLLVEHIGYSNAGTNRAMEESYTQANRGSKKAYTTLLSEGIPDLYYLSKEELSIPSDGWVDHIHPSDLGMQAQADAVEKKAREILKIPTGDITSCRPVTQRRDPNYEWLARHRAVLEANRESPPRAVIIGNSIIHYWSGEPEAPIKNGPESWDKALAPDGYRNMGFASDRIENALWRIYNGEMDGISPEKILVMIGTNNIGTNTEHEITEGIRFLLAAVKERQPDADLIVAGLLPRRGNEALVKSINKTIERLAAGEGFRYIDPGASLLQPDGKIDESLFSDGLHPTEKGYEILAGGL